MFVQERNAYPHLRISIAQLWVALSVYVIIFVRSPLLKKYCKMQIIFIMETQLECQIENCHDIQTIWINSFHMGFCGQRQRISFGSKKKNENKNVLAIHSNDTNSTFLIRTNNFRWYKSVVRTGIHFEGLFPLNIQPFFDVMRTMLSIMFKPW